MIILATVILINLCVVLSFCLMVKKNLRSIELFVYWLFSTIPVQNAAALEIDFSLVSLPEQQGLLWAYTLDRLILTPTVIVWFLNDHSGRKTKSSKWLAWLICLIVLVGIQWGGFFIGLFKLNYSLWWDLPKWLLVMILSFLFMKFFQFKLRK